MDKKVIKKHWAQTQDSPAETVWLCPYCGAEYYEYEEMSECDNCGKELIWGE